MATMSGDNTASEEMTKEGKEGERKERLEEGQKEDSNEQDVENVQAVETSGQLEEPESKELVEKRLKTPIKLRLLEESPQI